MHNLFDDLFSLNQKLWIISQKQDLPVYDFDFGHYFELRRPLQPPRSPVIARIGGFGDYPQHFDDLAKLGMTLINSPQEHDRCSEIHHWYPLLQDITPRSVIFDAIPNDRQIEQVGADLGWPLFMKGSRQTSRHRKSLSIIENAEHFRRALAGYEQAGILDWQRVACRQFVPLRTIEEIEFQDRLPSSFEFRTFWWMGKLVGFGRYWYGGKDYAPTPTERQAAINLATEAAARLQVPFLVIDIAQDRAGRWWIIECNDAQESGYAGVAPIAMWQAILDLT